MQNNNGNDYPIPYTIYKKKAALRLSMMKPRVQQGKNGNPKVRPGALLFEIANAVGDKKYDWENKITFSISAQEVVDIDMAVRKGLEHAIYHDPGKGKSDEGKIVKTLKLKRHKDNKSTIFQFGLKQNGSWTTAMIVVNDSEFALLRTFMFYAMPRIYNW